MCIFGFFISFKYCSAFLESALLLGTRALSSLIVDIRVASRDAGIAVLNLRRLLRAIDYERAERSY